MDEYLSIKKTADEFGLPVNMLRNMVKKGECPGFYIGAKFMVNVDMLDELLKEKSKQGLKN